MPFDITAAVVLPDHIHFVWTLPPEDDNYSKRVGRLKVLFTRSFKGISALPQDICISRQRQRESDVWQRRFWEHTIRDEADWIGHINYLHYNPVKHGLVECPHQWEFSSFRRFVKDGFYGEDWGCRCEGKGRRQRLSLRGKIWWWVNRWSGGQCCKTQPSRLVSTTYGPFFDAEKLIAARDPLVFTAPRFLRLNPHIQSPHLGTTAPHIRL